MQVSRFPSYKCGVNSSRVFNPILASKRQQSTMFSRLIVCMAKPSKKGPTKTVKIYCAKCATQLYKYRKAGKGSLVKCWHERIVEDFTNGDLRCPKCDSEFARFAMIRGRPANKIIGGKVYMKK